MSDYQRIRAVIEGPLLTAFNSQVPPVPVYFDNITFVPPDPPNEYVRVNLTFGVMTETAITQSLDRARGALIVRCFAQKNRGPARCQELVSIAALAMRQIGKSQKTNDRVFARVFDLRGPIFPNDSIEPIEPGQSLMIPHFQARIDASWQAIIPCT
jgi:hypothetical protein